jgi:DNA repair exonuclease SbcCD ATPase subunit
VKIEQVTFHGFGKWVDQSFSFTEGINLIVANNEWGKSTLLQGIIALLYGEKKEGLRTKRVADWYGKYIPWEVNRYGGEIIYSLNGERFRLYRNLFIDKDVEQLINLTHNQDWTDRFPMDKKKDRLILEKQLGLSGDHFRQIVFFTTHSLIPQSQKKGTMEQKLFTKLRSLLREGEEMDLAAVKKQLESEIQQLGIKKDAKNKPYGKLYQEMIELEQKSNQLEETYQKLKEEEARLLELKNECQSIRKLEKKQLQKCEEIKEQLSKAKQKWEIEKYIVQEQSLKEKLDHFRKLVNRRKNLQKKRAEIQPPQWIRLQDINEVRQAAKELKEKELCLAEHKQKMEQLEVEQKAFTEQYKNMIEMGVSEPEQMLDQLTRYQRLEELLTKGVHPEDEKQLACIEKDLEQLQKLDKEKKQLEAEIAAQPLEAKRLNLWWYILGGLGLITVLLYIYVPWFWIFTGLGTIACFYPIWREKGRLDQLRNQQVKQREKIKENQSKQDRILHVWKVNTLFELIQQRDELRELVQAQKSIEQKEEELEQIRQKVKSWLLRYVKKVPAFRIDEWEYLVIQLKQQREEIIERVYNYSSTKAFLQKQYEKDYLELQELSHTLNYYYNQYQVTDLKQMEDWFNKCEEVRQLDFILDELSQQIDSFTPSGPQLEKEMIQIQRKRRELEENGVKLEEKELEEQLEKAKKEVKRLENIRREKEQLKANIEGQIQVLREQTRFLPRVRAEYEKKKQQVRQVEREREALEITLQVLTESAKETEDQIAPYLLPYASKWIKQITAQKYQEILLDHQEKSDLKVVIPELSEHKSVEELSTGTIDQIYFALRLAMLEFYSERTKTYLPFILDDCFVHFDQERLIQSLEILGEIAKRHQVILCTCQPQMVSWLDEKKIAYHQLMD